MIARQRGGEGVTGLTSSPLLSCKDYDAPSVFLPENLLRDARRQKGLALETVPSVCVLDPDGDIVRRLRADGRATPSPAWACYHTLLDEFDLAGTRLGIVGGAVGASFAVLVAEQLFASGCRLLISLTSAGQITALAAPPYVILIDKALRDEGTSHHYLAPAPYSFCDPAIVASMEIALATISPPVRTGASWTTDAPFRETAAAIADRRDRGIAVVEMEAAALYAFAAATGNAVLCFANVTNQMGQAEGDFEKGEQDGTSDALVVLAAAVHAWTTQNPSLGG